MGTPIGTPPNAIALKYLNDPEGLEPEYRFRRMDEFLCYPILLLYCLSFGSYFTDCFPLNKNIEFIKLRVKPKRLAFHCGLYHFCYHTVILWMFVTM